MNVLSLFDGMSCGQIAFKEENIKVDKYYASEIDKHAIAQTQLNFPDTIQLGSVTEVDVDKLDHIDLLIGGSPCQSFSFAGKRKGMVTTDEIEITTLEQYLELKEQGFEFEGQSYLFWEYMRILTDIRKYNPNIKFLLENVEMGKKWETVLNNAIGIQGVHINSALVSAQNRKRIYWTNIKTKTFGFFGDIVPDIPQPKDMGILLKDIIQAEVDNKYYLKTPKVGFNGMNINGKNNSLRVGGHSSQTKKHNYDLICVSELFLSEPRHKHGENRYYENKAPTIQARYGTGGDNIPYVNDIRRLTPAECAKLQTIPDWYKWKCSDTQIYKMLGNGWTVKVIQHIFSFLDIEQLKRQVA